jgi:uncharacterized protein
MKKLLLALLIIASALVHSTAAQVPTQEQLQAADGQLNQIYKQLIGTLTEGQKQQLKTAQRQWIKQRDALVTRNPGNPQGALYQATMQRVAALQGALQQVNGQLTLEKTNDHGVGTAVKGKHTPSTQYNKVEPIYQEANWENLDVVADVLGTKYRAVSVVGSNKIFVFDVKTKLLYGVIEMSVGMMTEMDPARFICFSGNERYIYSQKTSNKGECFQFNEVPSLLTAFGQNCYMEAVEGPFMDSNKNLGVCVHRLEPPTTYYFNACAKIGMNQGDNGGKNTEFLRKYPDLACNLGEFDGNPIDPASGQAGNLVLDREGVCTTNQIKADLNVFTETQKEKTLAAGVSNNTVLLHNELSGEKLTIAIDFDNLTASKKKWTGPTIIKNSGSSLFSVGG